MTGTAEILSAIRELSHLKGLDRTELHGLLQDGIHAALAKKHGANVQAEVEIDEIVRFVADPPRVGAEAIRNWLRPYTEQSVSQDYIRLLRPATTSVLGTARDESL